MVKLTRYSDRIEGSPGNYNWTVRFDDSEGFLGITQIEDDKVKDRVLLSPKQVKAMTDFLRAKVK